MAKTGDPDQTAALEAVLSWPPLSVPVPKYFMFVYFVCLFFIVKV